MRGYLLFLIFTMTVFSLLEGWNSNINVSITFYGNENQYPVLLEINKSLLNGSQLNLSDIRVYYPEPIEKYRFFEKATDDALIDYWLSWDYDNDGSEEIFVHIFDATTIFQIPSAKSLGIFLQIHLREP